MPKKFKQIIVGRARATHDVAYEITCFQKPNKKLVESFGWVHDSRINVVVLYKNKDCGIISHKEKDGFVKIYFEDFVVYNCYLFPNVSIKRFGEFADKVMSAVRKENI